MGENSMPIVLTHKIDLGKTVKKSINYAFCSVCYIDVNISAGMTQLQQHKTRTNHTELAKSASKQSKFVTKNESFCFCLSSKKSK